MCARYRPGSTSASQPLRHGRVSLDQRQRDTKSPISRYSASLFSTARKPWPSPSITWNSTSPPDGTDALDEPDALFDRHDGIGVAVEHEERRRDAVGERERRALAVERDVVERTDERQRVVRLEAMAARREVGEIGDRIQGDAGRGEPVVQAEHAEHRHPAGRPAHHDGALRDAPPAVVRRRQDRGRVVDVEAAPFAAQGLLVGAAVARGPARIGDEHVPALRPPVGDTRQELDLPLVGGSAVDPAQRAARAGDVAPGVQRGAVVLDGDQLRLRQLDGVPTDDGTRRPARAAPTCRCGAAVSYTTIWVGVRAPLRIAARRSPTHVS